MRFFCAVAPAVVAVLVLEAPTDEIEKAIPIVAQRGALVAAMAYVSLGVWVAAYLGNGAIAWHWVGNAMTMSIATVYFFTLMMIGIGAASVRLRRRTR